MGYLLLQDQGEQEMLKLAFGSVCTRFAASSCDEQVEAAAWTNNVFGYSHGRSATDYFLNSDIQMFLGLKMWKREVFGSNVRRRLLFLQFVRSPNPFIQNGLLVPDLVLSCGNCSLTPAMVGALVRLGLPANHVGGFVSGSATPMCQNEGQAPYVVSLPHGPVCFDATFPIPPSIVNGFDIDLFNVQEFALEYDK